ncbi:MAG: hypothetical protein ACOYJ6_19630 [Caulobacterales bacterium]
MSTRGVKTNLPIQLADTIERIAQERGRSVASLVAEALQSRFGGETPQAQEASNESAKRQLARIEARLDALVAEKAVLKECLLAFVRVWLEHNPPIPEEIADSVAASADARFDRFLDFVADGLGPGRSIAGQAFAQVEPPAERGAS